MSIQVTAAHIANDLAAKVHAGQLQAGDMFPSERELCERFGIGRSVVREAMTILQGIRLADHAKGKRPRVVTPTLGQLMIGMGDAAKYFFSDNEGRAHLEQARLFLETSMLRHAVVHASNAHFARLLAAIDDCEKNIDDAEGFRNSDVAFHRVLTEIPGNPIFIGLHEAFVEKLMNSRPVLGNYELRNKLSNDEHRLIVKAMLEKNAETAVTILDKHLTRNYGTYFEQALSHRTK
ncbi:MAG: DNA-binding FadR family transcriptional regulator [Granulosicoccus sp.]|jgi:DNA-binding FadR family transcriptional regulator